MYVCMYVRMYVWAFVPKPSLILTRENVRSRTSTRRDFHNENENTEDFKQKILMIKPPLLEPLATLLILVLVLEFKSQIWFLRDLIPNFQIYFLEKNLENFQIFWSIFIYTSIYIFWNFFWDFFGFPKIQFLYIVYIW